MVEHLFGGLSTDLKLSIVESYLRAYTKALRRQFKQLWYIDAFAGTGHRDVKVPGKGHDILGPAEEERKERRRGSATIALEVEPQFDRLIFVETKPSFRKALDELCEKHPGRNVTILADDANVAILGEVSRDSWAGTRAVMFLDPYGMQVDWTTLEVIAKTRAIDVWYLVSLEGLFRQATHDPEQLTVEKSSAITRMLGTGEWLKAWYPQKAPDDFDLFGKPVEAPKQRADVTEMERFVWDRLKTIFGAVLPPLRLYNDGKVPAFALFFAISNREGPAVGLATRIADHILRAGISS